MFDKAIYLKKWSRFRSSKVADSILVGFYRQSHLIDLQKKCIEKVYPNREKKIGKTKHGVEYVKIQKPISIWVSLQRFATN